MLIHYHVGLTQTTPSQKQLQCNINHSIISAHYTTIFVSGNHSHPWINTNTSTYMCRTYYSPSIDYVLARIYINPKSIRPLPAACWTGNFPSRPRPVGCTPHMFTNATNEKLVLMLVTNENSQEFSLVDEYTKILKHYWGFIGIPLI